jgi:hypothetical protein
MTALINMPRAARKRQPSGRVGINYALLGTANGKFYIPNSAVTSLLYPDILDGSARFFGYNATGAAWLAGTDFSYWRFPLGDESSQSITVIWSGVLTSNNGVLVRDYTSGGGFIPIWNNAGTYDVRLGGTDYTGAGSWAANTQQTIVVTGSAAGVRLFANGQNLISSSTAPASATPLSRWVLYRNGSSTSYVAGETNLLAILSSPLKAAVAQQLSVNPWQLFTPPSSRFYLIPSSGGGLSPVYQDGLIRWNLLEEVQQDASLRWDVATTVHNDQVVRWNLLEGVLSEFSVRWNLLVDVQQDITARWDTLTTAQQEVIVRWNALDSVQQNQTLRWDVLSSLLSVQNDVVLRWDALSAVQQDALLRWNLANEVAQSLNTRWNLLKSVEISQDLRWDIAVEVANQVALRWDLLASLTAENDLTLRWDLLAIAENEIELRWNVGDQLQIQTVEARVFLVRGEDRVFKVNTSDRAFAVNASDRTIGVI